MTQPKMSLEDWLDDLCARFIINLPQEDLSSVARICFHVEEAQWFYEDFIRPLDPTLPSMSLRSFCLRIFQHCPLLSSFSAENHMQAFEEFLQYKTRVPVRGGILLNEAMDSAILVKGWKKGANWSFPRGKINKDEPDLDCAIREVYEETGFDIRTAGLVPEKEDVKYIEVTMKGQQLRLYVFRNVPADTVFIPQTRKEISKVEWYKLSELPAFRKKKGQDRNEIEAATNANKFYMVAPFLVPLKKWVVQQKKKDAQKAAVSGRAHRSGHIIQEDIFTEDDIDSYQPPPASRAQISNYDIDAANRELHRLIQLEPPTQGLQIPQAVHDGDAGQALLTLLQPQSMNQHHRSQGIPHTPFDAQTTQPQEPRTPHHHHPQQRAPLSSYDPPPNFPIAPQSQQQYYSNQQGQFPSQVPPEFQAQHSFPGAPGLQQSHPIPLLHPQPLPPQVQQTILMRGMFPTPAPPHTSGANSASNGAAQSSHGHPQQQNQLYQQQVTSGSSSDNRIQQNQIPAHTMDLLNTLKGNPPQANHSATTHVTHERHAHYQQPQQQQPVDQQSYGYQSQTQTAEVRNSENPEGHIHQSFDHQLAAVYLAQQQQSSGHHNPTGYYPYQGAANVQSQSAQSVPPQAQLPLDNSRAPLPTDKHRSSLLDMFKNTSLTSPSSQPAELSTSSPGGKNGTIRNQPAVVPSSHGARQGQHSGQVPQAVSSRPVYDSLTQQHASDSPAGVLQTAAREQGRPVQIHPELNLPFGAVSLLQRPRPGAQGEDPHPSSSPAQTTAESPRVAALKAQNKITQPKIAPHVPIQTKPGKAVVAGEPTPPLSSSYPYGASHDHAPSSFMSSPPAASALPMPTMFNRRLDANPEQKQKLLSLFGKQQGADDRGKSRESADAFGSGGTPRSRVASIASGDGLDRWSRRGSSQNPAAISPSDQAFLLNILKSQK